MKDKLEALYSNNTWTIVPLASNLKLICCRGGVYKTKCNDDGSINKFKARLVAEGYMQLEGVEYYKETFAPMSKMTTLMTVLSIAMIK